VQQKLETLFAEAKCKVQRINWKSSTPVSESITRWSVQTRFKGNPACLIKITRAFGATKPLLRVQDFSFSSRKIDGQVRNKINAVVELFVLHMPAKVTPQVNKELNNQANNAAKAKEAN
jgi:ribosomal protein L22